MKFFDNKTITISFIERLGLFLGSFFLSLFMFSVGFVIFNNSDGNKEMIFGGFLIVASIGLLFFNTMSLLGYGMERNNTH